MPDQGSPEVFVSCAWGDKTLDASQEASQRQEVVERLCETLDKQGRHIPPRQQRAALRRAVYPVLGIPIGCAVCRPI
jgi:hypothetical protein